MIKEDHHNICKVLIIDDEKDLCLLLQSICRKKGMTAHIANNLSDASIELEQHPHLIFLDNNLPDGLGLEFIYNIREHTDHACLILMTAENSDHIEERAFEKGVDYFMLKPFNLALLSKLIDKIAC
ncbi:MAG: response regulator [Chitinophagaceae bacterium]